MPAMSSQGSSNRRNIRLQSARRRSVRSNGILVNMFLYVSHNSQSLSFCTPSAISQILKKHALLDEMRKITRAAKDQESKLRADLREAQRKFDAEQKYAEKVREEREELRREVKRQKIELESMEEKVKTLEADVAKTSDDLRIHVTDAIQREVEKCTRKYVDSLDSCFPGATFIFSCDEGDSPADADHGDAASQQTQNSAKQRLESAGSAADNENLSE